MLLLGSANVSAAGQPTLSTEPTRLSASRIPYHYAQGRARLSVVFVLGSRTLGRRALYPLPCGARNRDGTEPTAYMKAVPREFTRNEVEEAIHAITSSPQASYP